MVLEHLISIREIRKKPYKIFILSIISTLIAILLTNFLSQNGLFLTFLITLAILPITINNLRLEEKREKYDFFWNYLYSLNFIYRHFEIIVYYLSIIFGITLTISFSYLILPPEISTKIFSNQIQIISQITGNFSSQEIFSKILLNNLFVISICFIFSLFYSTGAIFLITWNATVLGIAVGQGARQLFGIPSIPLVLLSYLPHGIFEFLGYVFAGIAGGILSIAITRHKESKKHKIFVLKDSVLLFFVGVGFIIIGAIVESFLI